MKTWYENLSNEQIGQLKMPKKWENMPTLAGGKVSANYVCACACGGQYVYRGPDKDDTDVNSGDDYYHQCNHCGCEAYLDHKYPYLVLPAETTEKEIKSDRND